MQHRREDRAALPDEPARLAGHRPARPAEQGDRRAERVRARGRHPPARHAHPPRDLRDHAAGGGRVREEPARPRQALRAARAEGAARRARLPRSTTRPSTRSSRTSRSSPTRRRTSTTPTSRRSSSTARSSRRAAAPGSSRRSPPPPAPARCRSPRSRSARADGEQLREAATGDGPVDAVYRAIEKITGIPVKLRDYQIVSVSTGEDAQGEVSHRGRARDRRLPRPRALHRHHRGLARARSSTS